VPFVWLHEVAGMRPAGGVARPPRIHVLTICFVSVFAAGIAGAQNDRVAVQSVVEALRDRDYVKALSLSKALTQAKPGDPRAWTLKGMALAGLGERSSAVEAFDQALQLDPNYVPALKASAQIQYDAGSPEAEKLLDKLVSINSVDQTAHAMLGAMAYKRKDCGGTVAHYSKSPQVISDSPMALAEFGACLLRANRPGDAIPVLQRLEQVRPDDWRSRYYLGLAQFLAHRYADAIQTIQPLTEGASANANALNLIAGVYEADHQTPKAVSALQRAIQLAPDNVDNYLDLGALCLDHGAFQVGVDVLSAAQKIVPDSAALHLERGALYVQMARFDEADADFDKANALQPAQSVGVVARGITLVQKNELGRALETVRERRRQTPDDAVLNYLLAEILLRKGAKPGASEFQEAVDAAQHAVHLKPDFALAYDVLSALYLRSGQTRQAEEVSRRAVKEDPNDSTAVYHLIACLRKQGDKQELPQLVKRLAEMAASAREQNAATNRYKLVEEKAGVTPPVN